MGKITLEFETEYNVGDVVVFEKENLLHVGIIEGYYVDDGAFWFNIRISNDVVFSYSNKGDIAEYDIVGKLENVLEESCKKIIFQEERKVL